MLVHVHLHVLYTTDTQNTSYGTCYVRLFISFKLHEANRVTDPTKQTYLLRKENSRNAS